MAFHNIIQVNIIYAITTQIFAQTIIIKPPTLGYMAYLMSYVSSLRALLTYK